MRSTRYTTSKRLRNEKPFPTEPVPQERKRIEQFVELTDNEMTNITIIQQLENARKLSTIGTSDDLISLTLPQAFLYRGFLQMNARSLRHFLGLRLNRSAHFQIRTLAEQLLLSLPQSHWFLYEDIVNDRATIEFKKQFNTLFKAYNEKKN
jgi:thymidylate synthase ThyX